MDFYKLTAAGNDFICVDDLEGDFDSLLEDRELRSDFARALCSRQFGISADGVIFARQDPSGEGDFVSLTLESDGSECELCGNGMACISHFAISTDIAENDTAVISTPVGLVHSHKTEKDTIRIAIPNVCDFNPDINIDVGDENVMCDFIISGIPHTATFVNDLDQVDVSRIGYAIRHHDLFQPRGVNANFVQIYDEGIIGIRTFEFGVEGETLSCGTGSCASAILSALRYRWNEPITSGEQPVLVHVRSGEILRVFLNVTHAGIPDGVGFETQVRSVMRGTVDSRWLSEITESCCVRT